MPVYVVDKPLGVTSHDVVSRARKLLRTRRVGHGGTLDPLATGVLAILAGEATKLSPFLTGSPKRYLAWISFGATTPTLDAEGPLSNPEPVDGAMTITESAIREALPPFLAMTEQVPPDYSAVKRGGVKGYEAARRGESLELPARAAGYRELELLAFAPSRDELPMSLSRQDGRWLPSPDGQPVPLPSEPGRFPSALVDLEVESGTFVRSFARDLGAALGVPAFLSGLRRTAAGRLGLEQAVAVDSLPDAKGLAEADALPFPQVRLSDAEADRVRKGQRLPLQLAGRTTLIDEDDRLVAVAESQEGRMKLLRVWGLPVAE